MEEIEIWGPPQPKMSMWYRWFKRRNIKWLIRWHEIECVTISKIALEDNTPTGINWGAEAKVEHKIEIKRLLKKLEEL